MSISYGAMERAGELQDGLIADGRRVMHRISLAATLALLIVVPAQVFAVGEAVNIANDSTAYPAGTITIVTGYYKWNPDTKKYYLVDTGTPENPLPRIVNSFRDYIYGVVRREINATHAQAQTAQALAAVCVGINGMQPNNKINGTTGLQAFTPDPLPEAEQELNLQGACNVVTGVGKLMKYTTRIVTGNPGTYIMTEEDMILDASYYYAPTSFTRNPEDGGMNYVPYLRRSISGPGISGELPPPEDLHCVGMNQKGMVVYAEKGDGFGKIARHFYHPSPPVVLEVRVLADGVAKYEAKWVFNEDKDAPKRLKTVTKNEKFPITGNLRFEIVTSEDMAHVIDGTQEGAGLFKLALKWNDKSHEIALNRSKSAGEQGFRRSYYGELSSETMKELGMAGTITLSIDGYHFYATTWKLDRDPGSVSFDGSENYQKDGPDENHSIEIECPVESTSVTIGDLKYKRVSPITLAFKESVKNVSVVEPAGLVTFSGKSEDPGPSTTFTGEIDLSNICLDGQEMCLKVKAASVDCNCYKEITTSAAVPNVVAGDEPKLEAVSLQEMALKLLIFTTYDPLTT